MRLTSRNVRSLEPGEYRDPQVPGLILRVWDTGRAWGFRYTFQGERRREDLGAVEQNPKKLAAHIEATRDLAPAPIKACSVSRGTNRGPITTCRRLSKNRPVAQPWPKGETMKRLILAVLMLALVIPAQSQPRAPKSSSELPRHGGETSYPLDRNRCNQSALVTASYWVLASPVRPQPTPQEPPCTDAGPDGYALALCEASRETVRLQAELDVAQARESRLRDLKRHADRCGSQQF